MSNRSFIFLLLAGALIMFIILRIQGSELITPVSPLGILSLEFSNDANTTAIIVDTWRRSSQVAFTWNMIFDFFFIFFYGGFLYFSCLYFSWLIPSWSRIANTMAIGALAAAGLDILENIMMIISFNGGIHSTISYITFVVAALKFVFAFLVITFIIVGTVYSGLKKKV